MKIQSLRDSFKDQFGSTLRVYDGRSLADDSETVGSIAKQKISRGSTISAHGRTKVGNFENNMLEVFGIRVQIADSKDKFLVDDDVSLTQSGRV